MADRRPRDDWRLAVQSSPARPSTSPPAVGDQTQGLGRSTWACSRFPVGHVGTSRRSSQPRKGKAEGRPCLAAGRGCGRTSVPLPTSSIWPAGGWTRGGTLRWSGGPTHAGRASRPSRRVRRPPCGSDAAVDPPRPRPPSRAAPRLFIDPELALLGQPGRRSDRRVLRHGDLEPPASGSQRLQIQVLPGILESVRTYDIKNRRCASNSVPNRPGRPGLWLAPLA